MPIERLLKPGRAIKGSGCPWRGDLPHAFVSEALPGMVTAGAP